MIERSDLDLERLQDYLDGRLSPSAATRVTAELMNDPERAAEVQRLREIDSLLGGIGAQVLDEPVPERLLTTVRQAATVRSQSQQAAHRPALPERESRVGGWAGSWRFANRWAMGAIAAGLFLSGTWVGWESYQFRNPQPSFDDLALSDAARAYTVYGGRDSLPMEFAPDRLGELSAWVDRTFHQTIDPPDISALGFQFVGGRVLPGLTGRSFMYLFENADGQRVGLVFWGRDQDTGVTGMIARVQPGLQSRQWNSGNLGYALLGDEGSSELDALSEAVQGFYQAPEAPALPEA